MTRRGRPRGRKTTTDPSLRNPCGRKLSDYVEVAWVISEAGVSYAAFRDWRQHRGYTECPAFWRASGRTFVHWDIAMEYLEGDGIPRVPEPPIGWVPMAKAKAMLGGVGGEHLTRAARRGELKAVRRGERYYFEPQSLQAYVRLRSVPDGWKTVGQLARELGLDSRTVLNRADAVGAERRYGPDPTTRRRVRYFSPLDAEKIAAYRGIRRRPPAGWVRIADAAEARGWNRRNPQAWIRYHKLPMVYVSGVGARGASSYCPQWVWDQYVAQRERRGERRRGSSREAA